MKINTERLVIRPLQAGDAEALSNIWTNPEVTLYMGGPRNYQEIHADFIEDAKDELVPKFDLWTVIENSTGQIIGHCGLLDKDIDGESEIELIYVLARSAWGNGYATEAALAIKDYAFGELGLERIVSLINPLNTSSEHVAVKAGLRYEKDIMRPGGKIMRVFAISASDDI